MLRSRLPWLASAFVLLSLPITTALGGGVGDANRLAYLDDPVDPYYVSRAFPRLTTPQWVGEPDVDAVVILAIDDMRDPAKYEKFLRPCLDRLKKIDGRAPVSIMTCKVDPADPKLQAFLKEGLSLEVHTVDHPCPLLANGDLQRGRDTYDNCVDLMFSIAGNRPVAFRTPCCDSKNTVSPRFFAEIFNHATPGGHFLTIDSSVFNVPTSNDPALPRNLVQDEQGRERFRRYLPFPNFVNTIDDYPYPYVIGRQCWEFPCAVPSDWESHNIQGDANPQLLADWEAQLDATVIKQGTMTLVFHPYGWSSPQQLANLVDYADKKFGKRVKFLTFREAQERIDKNLLAGQPIRNVNGEDNGVRLMDLNNDGYMDVVIGNEALQRTRVWLPETRSWAEVRFPTVLRANKLESGVRFGIVRAPEQQVCALVLNENLRSAWRFNGDRWVRDDAFTAGLDQRTLTSIRGVDQGTRLRDIDGDGICELVGADAIYRRTPEAQGWTRAPFELPRLASPANDGGGDIGLRFVDVNGDGRLDVLFSNGGQYSLHLFTSMEQGWSEEAVRGNKGDANAIPSFVRADHTNNGAFFHGRSLWVQNEDTSGLADLVDQVPFNKMLAKVEPNAPRSAEASLKSIQARPGFQVELMAAEPLVEDPIAFAFGADGKLWVVEMGDYPLGLDGSGKPGGRVKFLESTRGDGHYDKATVFLDHLPFPTGVTPWRKGVIVTCAPDIFYAEDTDGDGKADKREVLFTGFNEGNQQHRVNGLVYGLDNWLYGANGHSGGNIRSTKTGEVIDINHHDFRLRPDAGTIEPEAGMTQYGRSRDDWGDWFGCDNSNPSFHFALPERYLRRNPHFIPPPGRVPVPQVPGTAPVYPISRTIGRFNDFWAADHFTSANSLIVYRDDLFGPAFSSSTFVSEPVHNLVHREILSAKGGTFTSRRADDEQTSEFLASSDNWFRPTMLKTGPDGALWVADMYRYVIEHPQWIPPQTQKKLDLRAGHERGRLYRVYPVGAHPRPIPRLDRIDAAALVAALDTPSGWQRDMAQQLLVERQDKAAVPLLARMATESKRPEARLQALCALDGLHAITAAHLKRALSDPHPGVRRHAVRLTEPLLEKDPWLGQAVSQLAGDEDAQVRMQVAYTLGDWPDVRAGDALARIALAAGDDPLLTAAVMSSINATNLGPMIRAATASGPVPPALLASLLKQAGAMGDMRAMGGMLEAVTSKKGEHYQGWQFQAMAALLDGLSQAGLPLSKATGDDRAAGERVTAIFAAARALAGDGSAAETERAAAIALLGREPDRQAEDLQTLKNLLAPQSPPAVQSAAVAAVARAKMPQSPQILLAGWKGYTPPIRGAVLDALAARPEWAAALLDAIEAKKVLPGDLDAQRRQKLLKNANAAVKARAAKVLAASVNPDRQKVIDALKDAVSLPGNAPHGKEVFAKTCATCHHLGDVGNAVGPDLASVGDKSSASLIVSILDPNRAVDPKYTAYVAETRDGTAITGILSADSGDSVTLLQADGKSTSILRSQLARLRSDGMSLMPEGLEAGLSAQDLADVMAFVRASGPATVRKSFDGNRPEVVLPGSKGALKLLPGSAEIYGSHIELEKQYGNLGQWTADDDAATWTVQPARAGKYTVWLTYACDDSVAGNTLLIQSGATRLTWKVEGTRNWDSYHRVKVGEVELGAGRQRISVRPEGKIAGALLDLKSVEMIP